MGSRAWLVLPLSLMTACVLAVDGSGPGAGEPQGSGAGTPGDTGAGAGGAGSTGGGQDGAGGAGGAGAGGAGAGGGAPGDWWDETYRSRVKISFKNQGREQLTDFPVLIRLDSARINHGEPQDDGDDLRFIDADQQTELPYEIERWDPGGDSFAWVRVPAIDADTSADHLWLYFDNDSASTPAEAEVWGGFAAVYHFRDDVLRDSGPGGLDGTEIGSVDSDSDGKIAGALSLDGGGYLQIDSAGELSADPGEGRTLEAWIRTSRTAVQAVFSQELNCKGYGIDMGQTNSRVRGRFFAATSSCGSFDDYYADTGNDAYSDDQWHYLALVVDRPGGRLRLYIDGSPYANTPIDNEAAANSSKAWIGSIYNGTIRFEGLLDELRVSTSARSADWLDAQHASMSDELAEFHEAEHLP